MKTASFLVFIIFLVGCNTFHPNRILRNEKELLEIIKVMDGYGDVILEYDSDERIGQEMNRLGINYIHKNVTKNAINFVGFVEQSDSLVIFQRKSYNIFSSEKRIIYDFAEKPRDFDGRKIPNAGYEIRQINERWYFSIQGFD